ncbi:hypothetical protein BYT27DRAFT_7207977 [Phlegmacium glaucopus]|nr:hypothetical protein BYT27DRAFT_7207977 [Phlegmacium glaucopus]
MPAPVPTHPRAFSVVVDGSSSDDSDTSKFPAALTYPRGHDRKQTIILEKALKEAQARSIALSQEIKALKAANVDLQMRLAKSHKPQCSNESDPESSGGKANAVDAAKLGKEICKLGKRHVILYSVFLTHDAFGSNNIELGPTAELYASIPAKFHQYLSTISSVADEFIKGMNSERSTALHIIRGVAVVMFDHEDLPSECFTQRSFSRSSLDRVQFLLGTTVDSNGETANPDFPPIVFEDNNPAMARGVFRNDVLFKIARVVIYGKQALVLKHTDGRLNFPSLKSNSPFSRKDCPLQTTAGLIAFAAIAVRFILSDDETWPSTGVGPKSSINYGDTFNTYKHFLIVGHHKEESRRSIELLFQRWDAEVFPKKAGVASTLGTHDMDAEVVEERRSAEFADFFNRMQLEDSDANPDPLSDADSNIYMDEEIDPRSHHPGCAQVIPPVPIISTSSVVSIVHAVTIAQDVMSQAVTGPKPRHKPNVSAAKKALKIPQVALSSKVTIEDGLVAVDEVDAGGKPAGRATRNRKGKSQAK